jgi:hypothetical protein
MPCPEKLRLQQLYEVAIRRWAQIQATSQRSVPPIPAAEMMLKEALIERNAAKSRLARHKLNCTTCNPKAVDRAAN